MELKRYLAPLARWFWLILLSVAIAASASYYASQQATPLYGTKTTMMVGRVTQQLDPSSVDFQTGQRLALTYSQLADREPVLKGVIDQLDLKVQWQALAGRITATVVPQTQLFEISVVDTDPRRAKIIADTIAQQLILQSPTNPDGISQDQRAFTRSQLEDLQEKIEASSAELETLRQQLDVANSARLIQEIESKITIHENKITGWQNTYSQLLISMQGSDISALSVVEEAAVPARPFSPNVQANVMYAAFIGLVLSIGGILLIEYLDDTIRTEEDIKRITEVPVIGKIPTIRLPKPAITPVAYTTPLLPEVEAFRIMRTNLLFNTPNQALKTIMITSTRPGEGKTTIAANLAIVLAQYGQRVILVDGDLKSPKLHKLFDFDNSTGLTTALLNPDSNPEMYLKKTAVPNLRVFLSGKLPENPSFLLGSKRMAEVIEKLEEQADFILFDSPPLMISDTLILSAQMDGILLVSKSRITHITDVEKSMEQLSIIRANLIGMILNSMKSIKTGYYYGSYFHNNGHKNGHKKSTDNHASLEEVIANPNKELTD